MTEKRKPWMQIFDLMILGFVQKVDAVYAVIDPKAFLWEAFRWPEENAWPRRPL